MVRRKYRRKKIAPRSGARRGARSRTRPGVIPSTALTLALTGSLAGCGLLGGDGDTASGAGGGRHFSLAASGDILVQPQLVDQAAKDARVAGTKGYDFDKIMAGVKPVISKADLGICHLDPVLGKPDGPFQGHPDFLVPPQITTALKKVGYDSCSTASTHTLDHGVGGVKRTLDTLDSAGIKHTGSARDQAEAGKPLILDVKGVKVAQLSFSSSFNGRDAPKSKPWLVNKLDFDKIAAAEKAARKAGADVVVLSLHWGREQQSNASKWQISMAHRIATETGVNLVIGHHAHVVQPMEKIAGTWVAYGLGNHLARHEVPNGLTEEGAIGWFDFTEKGGTWDVRARFAPTLVEIPPDLTNEPDAVEGATVEQATPVREYRVVDVATALRQSGLSPELRSRYQVAFERTQGTVLNRGAAKDGLQPLQGLPG
ncbi:CapA family protein [Streptomyces sp. NPDC006879]|uniref:CapA family protein n=1 Tax=Streptomyces sp. NPDC006879 TaxID=3364767 RepID=UPI0036C54743